MYIKGKGICPPHSDRIECKYSINLCVAQNSVWDFYLEGNVFHLTPNSAVFYSGTHHSHWREKISAKNYADLITFHFTDIDI
jgi:hypothetical protein